MAQFGEESERDFSGISEDHNERKLSQKMLLNAGTYFRFFQEYCGNNFVRIDKNNMEDIYCIAETMAVSGIKTINLNGKTVSLEDLLTQIKLWLWKVFQQFPPANEKRKSRVNERPYQDFVSFLKENNIISRSAVVTTNYDLILENYTWKGDVQSCYPFSASEVCATSIGEETSSAYINVEESASDLIIYKLHGSVNYFDKEHGSGLKIFNGVTPAMKSVGESRWREDAPSVFFLDAVYEIKQRYPDYVPAIVAPTYAKIQASSWLQTIWSGAVTCLSNAKVIIFIGYGLPQTDGFVKAMFQTAFLGKGDVNPNIYVLNCDKTGKAQERYLELFPRNVYFNDGTFAEEWPNLGNQILEDINKLRDISEV